MMKYAGPLIALITLTSASLPQQGPLPAPRPETSSPAQPLDEKATGPEKPPTEKTADEEKNTVVSGARDAKETLIVAAEDAAEYRSCMADLKAIGATFHEVARIDEGDGCGIDKPVVVSKILPDVDLKPEGTMRCQTALSLARWVKDSVIPAAAVSIDNGGRLTTINQGTAYLCRLRNSATQGKISEHARGNAIDVISFQFEKAEPVSISPRKADPTLRGAFQNAVSASACLYFSTVLDPDSDAAHEDNLHLDIIRRKGDYRYCH